MTPARTRAPTPDPAPRQLRRRDVGTGDEIRHHHAMAGCVGMDVAGFQRIEFRQAGGAVERADQPRGETAHATTSRGMLAPLTADRKPRTTAPAISMSAHGLQAGPGRHGIHFEDREAALPVLDEVNPGIIDPDRGGGGLGHLGGVPGHGPGQWPGLRGGRS